MLYKNVDSLFFAFLFVLFAIIYLASIMSLPWLASLCFLSSFGILLIVYFFESHKELNYVDYFCFLTVSISLVCVFLNGILEDAYINFDYMKKWMMFSSTIIFFSIVCKRTYNSSFLGVLVKFLTIFLSIMTIFQFYLGGLSNYLWKGRLTNYLTMNFENPNKTALFFMPLCLMCIIVFCTDKRKELRVVSLLCSVFLCFFIFQTQSRTCMMSLSVFFFLVIFFKIKKPLTISFLSSFFITVVPLFYALFYVFLVRFPYVAIFFDFAEKEGKSLYSRENIWLEAFEHIENSPFVGAYYQISGGTGISQLHNTHVDILASYGLISFICFVVFMMLLLRKIKFEFDLQYLYFSAFVALLCCGFGEAALYSGGMGLYIIFGYFLFMSFPNNLISLTSQK